MAAHVACASKSSSFKIMAPLGRCTCDTQTFTPMTAYQGSHTSYVSACQGCYVSHSAHPHMSTLPMTCCVLPAMQVDQLHKALRGRAPANSLAAVVAAARPTSEESAAAAELREQVEELEGQLRHKVWCRACLWREMQCGLQAQGFK